jgi:hypothetical protein
MCDDAEVLECWRGAVATCTTWTSGDVELQFKTIPSARLVNEPESATLKMIMMENANHAKDNLFLTLAGMKRQAPLLIRAMHELIRSHSKSRILSHTIINHDGIDAEVR